MLELVPTGPDRNAAYQYGYQLGTAARLRGEHRDIATGNGTADTNLNAFYAGYHAGQGGD